MAKLISQQLPNDGEYHVKRLVYEENGRLDHRGKIGSRVMLQKAKIRVKKRG